MDVVPYVGIMHLVLLHPRVEVGRMHVKRRDVKRLNCINAHPGTCGIGERCMPDVGMVAGFLRTHIRIVYL